MKYLLLSTLLVAPAQALTIDFNDMTPGNPIRTVMSDEGHIFDVTFSGDRARFFTAFDTGCNTPGGAHPCNGDLDLAADIGNVGIIQGPGRVPNDSRFGGTVNFQLTDRGNVTPFTLSEARTLDDGTFNFYALLPDAPNQQIGGGTFFGQREQGTVALNDQIVFEVGSSIQVAFSDSGGLQSFIGTTINDVPLPASALLLGAAMAGIVTLRRKS